MERLTGRNEHGGIISVITGVHKGVERVMLLHKLAAYEDDGLSPERVAELAQAERDGRLIVLPVGIDLTGWENGNYCYWATGDEIWDCTILDLVLIKGREVHLWLCDSEHDTHYLHLSDIGKTVFLTRAEAEKANAAQSN